MLALFGAQMRRAKTPGGGGLTTTPSYIATGTFAEGSGAGIAPAYGTNLAGDLFLAIVYNRQRTADPATPAGWTLQRDSGANFSRAYVYTRDARSTGSESGTVSFATVAGNCVIAAIHTIRNVATSSFIEDIDQAYEASANNTVDAPTVDAAGIHRLAVSIGGSTGTGLTIDDFAGASGGTWNKDFSVASTVGSDGYIWLQTAPLASGGTISGGSYDVGSAEEVIGVSFALVGV